MSPSRLRGRRRGRRERESVLAAAAATHAITCTTKMVARSRVGRNVVVEEVVDPELMVVPRGGKAYQGLVLSLWQGIPR